MKVVFDELDVSATADELKYKKRPRDLDKLIMVTWYNATIESLYKEAGLNKPSFLFPLLLFRLLDISILG